MEELEKRKVAIDENLVVLNEFLLDPRDGYKNLAGYIEFFKKRRGLLSALRDLDDADDADAGRQSTGDAGGAPAALPDDAGGNPNDGAVAVQQGSATPTSAGGGSSPALSRTRSAGSEGSGS